MIKILAKLKLRFLIIALAIKIFLLNKQPKQPSRERQHARLDHCQRKFNVGYKIGLFIRITILFRSHPIYFHLRLAILAHPIERKDMGRNGLFCCFLTNYHNKQVTVINFQLHFALSQTVSRCSQENSTAERSK